VDEVSSNRNVCLAERIDHLPALPLNRIQANVLQDLEIDKTKKRLLAVHHIDN